MADETQEASAPTIATKLVSMALERYRFAATPDGEPFAVPLTSHLVRMLRGGSHSLRAELANAYYDATGKTPTSSALADALQVLEGTALRATPEPAYLRRAYAHGCLWIDRGDSSEQVIRVSPEGWTVTSKAPVLFRRTALTGPMPLPTRGNMEELWSLLNVTEDDRALVLGWLVAALLSVDAPCPALALFGEQGTGKSTAMRLLVDIVDPSPVPCRKPPRDSDSWVTAASGSVVVGLDNLSVVSDMLSDTLCRAVTGDGDVRRQLYTDGGLYTFAFKRAIIVNGIDLGSLRGDLAERLLSIQLERIPAAQRMSEDDLNRRWAEARPSILGALLAATAATMGKKPSVELDEKPRMADFATILAALDQLNGTRSLGRYADKAGQIAADTLAADDFIATLMNHPDEFTGTSAELLALLTPDQPPRGWPTPRNVTTRLRRHAPALRGQGWTVDDLGRVGKANAQTWHLAPPEGRRPGMNAAFAALPPNPDPLGETQAANRRQTGGNETVCRPDAAMLPPHETASDKAQHAAGGKAAKTATNTGNLPSTPPCPACGGPNDPERAALNYDCMACYEQRRGGSR